MLGKVMVDGNSKPKTEKFKTGNRKQKALKPETVNNVV